MRGRIKRMKGNVHVLPSTGFAPTNRDVAENLRHWADAIERDEAACHSAIIVMERDGQVHRAVLGGPNDRARIMGILFAAATMAVGQVAGWDDQIGPSREGD